MVLPKSTKINVFSFSFQNKGAEEGKPTNQRNKKRQMYRSKCTSGVGAFLRCPLSQHIHSTTMIKWSASREYKKQ